MTHPAPFTALPLGDFSPQAVETIHRRRDEYYGGGCPAHPEAKVTVWKELLVRDSGGQWHLPVTALYSCGHMLMVRLNTDDTYVLTDTR